MNKLWIVLALLVLITNSTSCSRTKVSNNKEIHSRQANPISRQTETNPDANPIPKQPIPEKKTQNPQNPQGITPSRIYIPSIDLHAAIEPVDVMGNGQMGVPKSTDKVGYLSNGVLPGAVGNAVMDGHVDSYTGPAIFFRLRQLNEGDVVIVKNERGQAIEFVVQAVKTYKTSSAPIPLIFGPSNESRLNLITCAGKYSRKSKEHQERLVVFAIRSNRE